MVHVDPIFMYMTGGGDEGSTDESDPAIYFPDKEPVAMEDGAPVTVTVGREDCPNCRTVTVDKGGEGLPEGAVAKGGNKKPKPAPKQPTPGQKKAAAAKEAAAKKAAAAKAAAAGKKMKACMMDCKAAGPPVCGKDGKVRRQGGDAGCCSGGTGALEALRCPRQASASCISVAPASSSLSKLAPAPPHPHPLSPTPLPLPAQVHPNACALKCANGTIKHGCKGPAKKCKC